MKKYSLFILFALLFSSTYAQTDVDLEVQTKNKATANLNILAGLPMGSFKERQAEVSFGFGGNLLFEVKKPVSIGLDVIWQQYDSASDFFIEFDEFGNAFDVEEEINNNIFGISGLIHVQPDIDFFIKPYAEGSFGINRFHTKTVLTDVAFNEQINVISNNSDWALTFGGAAGFLINVWQDLLFLDLKCVYRAGNTAEYYTRIEGANFTIPLDNFELKTSPTNMLIPQIGITFLLTNPEED